MGRETEWKWSLVISTVTIESISMTETGTEAYSLHLEYSVYVRFRNC